MGDSSKPTISSPVLGQMVEVCIVSPDYKRTVDGLMKLGVGPFQVFQFNKTTVPRQEWYGGPGDFELNVAFAKQGPLTFEIMQPTAGKSLMMEYLEKNGGKEGIQHVAFDMGQLPMAERQKRMKDRGFKPAMQGWWQGRKGQCHFCFFDTHGATGTVFETIEFSDDWEDPEFEWYPHAPPKEAGVEHGIEK
ncbi:hypothetical protein H2203_005908 [Taxawa tesnikishii (nom. ined.)]|nr:hypothetical protein H2203_005908 [Dothideales sp. JES 119]